MSQFDLTTREGATEAFWTTLDRARTAGDEETVSHMLSALEQGVEPWRYVSLVLYVQSHDLVHDIYQYLEEQTP